jgi:hypothetical protein
MSPPPPLAPPSLPGPAPSNASEGTPAAAPEAPVPPPRPGAPRLPRAGLAALLGAITLAWAPALHAPFTYDDRLEVVGNRTIRWLGDLGAIAGYNTSRPLLIATYALNWWIGGLDPLGYHLLSVGIHALNAWLAWRLAARLVTPERAALVAATWALHPMVTEAVTYVTGRSDALEGTAWLVALAAWIDHRRGAPRARIVAILATVAALATKEVGVLLPVALLAVDRWLAPRPRWRDHVLFSGAGVAAVALRVAMYGWPAPEVPRSALAQILGQAEVWVHLLALWCLPYGQAILHDHPAVARPLGVAALIGWIGVTTVLVRRARATPPASPPALRAFALALWATWLVPSSALPLLETMAEHRAYLAGYALVLALVASVPRIRPLWVLVPVLFTATVVRNLTWADEPTLWAEAAARNPESARAWYGYGDALRLARRFREAGPAYERVLVLEPADVDARVDLGIVRAEAGDPAGARSIWTEALRLDPHACAAHNDLAGLDFRAGNLSAAESGYASSLAWCPDDPIAHLNLANIAYARADVRKAAYHYREYLRVAEDGPAAPLARERLVELLPGAGAAH